MRGVLVMSSKKFIFKENLPENIVTLISLIMLLCTNGIILGLIGTAVFYAIGRIINNFTKHKAIGLTVQIVLSLLLAALQIRGAYFSATRLM